MKNSKDVYPNNGYVIPDNGGFRQHHYDIVIKSMKQKKDPRRNDEKYLKELRKKIFGVNWNE